MLFDATQVAQSDLPVEFSSIVTAIAIHITSFLTDLMVQYAQPRPWILFTGGRRQYLRFFRNASETQSRLGQQLPH